MTITMQGFRFSPLPAWVSGQGTYVHALRQVVVTGERTGRVISVGFVAACSGRQVGGAFGYSVSSDPEGPVCPRCAKKLGLA